MAKEIARTAEPFDYVAQMKNMNEASRKNKISQKKWQNEYRWLYDEYKIVEDEMRKLCEDKMAIEKNGDYKIDDRSVRRVPQTTNGLYGWLAMDDEFKLEKYGSYVVNYPNPLHEVTALSGNIPTLAVGNPRIL